MMRCLLLSQNRQLHYSIIKMDILLQVITEAEPDIALKKPPQQIAIWIIIVAAAGGLLVLIVIILIFWKVSQC